MTAYDGADQGAPAGPKQPEEPVEIPADTQAVVSCGPSPDQPNRRDSLLKEKKEMKKLVFSSFEQTRLR